MGKYHKQNKNRVAENSEVCNCGKHRGIGSATPHERAQMYNWYRQRDRREWHVNENGCSDYLISYEAAHGFLDPNSFIFNDSRFASK